MRSFLFLAFLVINSVFSSAQIFKPVKWQYAVEVGADNTATLIFEAKIDDGWSIYSQYLESDDGPIRTSFEFDKGDHFKLVGKNEESGNRKESYDKIFDMNLIKFKKSGVFKQKIKVSDFSKPITGFLEFMTCDDTKCLPPEQVDFEFKIVMEEKKTGDVPVQEVKKVEAPTAAPAPKEEVAQVEAAATEEIAKGNSQVGNSNTGGGANQIKKKPEEKKGDDYNPRAPEHSVNGEGKIFDPVDWSASINKQSDKEYEVVFSAKIDRGWHIYSRYLGEGDAIATGFFFEAADHYKEVGKGREESTKKVKEYDSGFDMELVKLKESADFYTTLAVEDASKPITGFYEFAVCDKTGCLPPELVPFKFLLDKNQVIIGDEAEDIAGSAGGSNITDAGSGISMAVMNGNEIDQSVTAIQDTYQEPLGDCGEEEVARGQNLWVTFLLGFLGGLVALLTPCVWPMIPLTVSFFTKGSTDRASGIKNGTVYGLSIIFIYVGLGLLITGVFGPTALNELSTNWIANLFFFALFVIFAFSFFGYFEITLPASWANKTDALAEKGGFLGTFFMAGTLALVSFSCTGPIIGSALVTAATNPIGPSIVMLGFSMALALPFGLFAAFPAWLNSLPKSGSWMTSVKVVLGFVELALALKFLSVADMTMHWGILKYELFLGLWILVALATAAYLFGFIRFPHDSPLKKLPPLRGALALTFLGFAIYLGTGFMTNQKTQQYNSLSLMSGLAPPAIYNFFKPAPAIDAEMKKEYLTYSKCANNLDCFKDYYEGMSYAKKNNMPVLLDFTGYGCVNCRKTEEHIWIDDRVWERLDQDFVLISLYVDDREKLEEILVSKNTQKRMRNVGNKWADFQIVNFEQNSQPLYVMMSPDEKVLAAPRGFKEGVKDYVDFLECGLETFNAIYGNKIGMLQ